MTLYQSSERLECVLSNQRDWGPAGCKVYSLELEVNKIGETNGYLTKKKLKAIHF